MTKRSWFTLLETLISLTIFFFVVAITLRAYLQTIDIKNGVEARQTLVQSSYFMMEKLQTLMKNYTIDYEEYFNRRMVWCDGLGDVSGIPRFSRSGWSNGHCDRFTAYGNENTLGGGVATSEHRLYYCSSIIDSTETANSVLVKAVPSIDVADFLNGAGCFSYLSDPSGKQSFGQYEANFHDVQDDVDLVLWSFWDDDDFAIGQWPDALVDSSSISEIYLISQNKNQRVFLRRKLVASWDWNGTGGVGDVPSDYLYTIQLLKLRGFDAWHNHDFDASINSWVYDGVIDTWACDFQEWFACGDSNRDWSVDLLDSYSSISTLYSGYVMPMHEDDGWVNLFGNDVTVTNFLVTISPTIDPDLARDDDVVQINPSITILLDTALYGKNWQTKVGEATVNNFDLTLQTTFDVKSFY